VGKCKVPEYCPLSYIKLKTISGTESFLQVVTKLTTDVSFNDGLFSIFNKPLYTLPKISISVEKLFNSLVAHKIQNNESARYDYIQNFYFSSIHFSISKQTYKKYRKFYTLPYTGVITEYIRHQNTPIKERKNCQNTRHPILAVR
jgi:hypothetical protein